MAIIINEDSRVIIQGITGRVGQNFAERMARHYSNFVGGVTPGKGGQEDLESLYSTPFPRPWKKPEPIRAWSL